MKPDLLWVGDATVASGFAEVTHQILHVLKETWKINVLGLNYEGDPHRYSYPIWPAAAGNGDYLGYGRIGKLVKVIKPKLIVLLNDPWNIPGYIKQIRQVDEQVPIVGFIAIDGKNCKGGWLNDLQYAIFWTKFAAEEARLGGYTGQRGIVPLGVDLDVFSPMDRLKARKFLGFPQELVDGFIVGNVNRNQPRKRMDLMIKYFAEWVKSYDRRDAFLYLHVAPTGDQGWDLMQLMQYYGFSGKNKRLIYVEPDRGYGIHETMLSVVYSTFDVQLTTTQGEGWGLPTMEGMACGIPQIVPDWSALGEWCENAAIKVPCSTTFATPNMVNIIGGVPDEQKVIEALETVYQGGGQPYVDAALELVQRPHYRWAEIGRAFGVHIEQFVPKQLPIDWTQPVEV